MTATAPGRLLLTAAATATIFLACFYYRLDYPAHVIAGFGAAGLGWVVLGPWVVSPGIRACLTVVGVVALGVLGELTVFGPEFDLVDVANTTMGSLLAVAVLAGGPSRRWRIGPTWAQLTVVSVGLIVVGLALRYPIQEATSQWWFGR